MKTRLVTYDDVEYGDIFTREGFGYAPIGTIIYRDGNVVPNGFLLCDGSTKSISSYSDLATYFQTTHGSKNYYGGNGSSTFGLPNIRRMPGDAPDEYSTAEKAVGVWTNGKPIYQTTFTGTLPSTSGSLIYINGTPTNVDKVIDIKGYYANGSGYTLCANSSSSGNSAVNILLGVEESTHKIILQYFCDISTYLGQPYSLVIQYTKTASTTVVAGHSPDGNGIWCIKATTDPTN